MPKKCSLSNVLWLFYNLLVPYNLDASPVVTLVSSWEVDHSEVIIKPSVIILAKLPVKDNFRFIAI